MPKAENLAPLRKVLSELAAIDVEKLVARADLVADFSFEPIRRNVLQIKRLSEELLRVDVELMPEQTLTNVLGASNNSLEAVKGVEKFTVRAPPGASTDNPMQRHAQLSSALIHASDNLTQQAAPSLTYLLLHDAKHQQGARIVLDDARAALAAAKETTGALDLMRSDATEILSKIREASGLTGVGAHAKDFAQAAATHDGLATKWMQATFALAGATIVVVLVLALRFPILANETSPQIAQYVVSRVSTIGLLAYASLFCVRNYRSHRHLAVANAHRANALATFKTFVNAASDEVTKAKVLEEATRCVFATTPSGYLAEDPEPSRIVEIIKSFGGKAG